MSVRSRSGRKILEENFMKKSIFAAICIIIFCWSANAQEFLGMWKMTSMLVEGDMVYEIDNMTISFGKDGKVGGNGGCNSFSGNYELRKPGKIKISGILSTMKFCEGISETESAFLTGLKSANFIEIKNNHLTIRTTKKDLFEFERIGKPVFEK